MMSRRALSLKLHSHLALASTAILSPFSVNSLHALRSKCIRVNVMEPLATHFCITRSWTWMNILKMNRIITGKRNDAKRQVRFHTDAVRMLTHSNNKRTQCSRNGIAMASLDFNNIAATRTLVSLLRQKSYVSIGLVVNSELSLRYKFNQTSGKIWFGIKKNRLIFGGALNCHLYSAYWSRELIRK